MVGQNLGARSVLGGPQTRQCQVSGMRQAVALGMRQQPVDLGIGEGRQPLPGPRAGSRLPTGGVVSLVDPGW